MWHLIGHWTFSSRKTFAQCTTSITTVAISVGRAKAKTRLEIKTTTNPRAACALIVLSVALFKRTRPARSNTIVDQVAANHVSSLLAAHLVDFASLDQDTVKPWLDGKIDFAPEVRDLSTNGFPLVGGRLDYLDERIAVRFVSPLRQRTLQLGKICG